MSMFSYLYSTVKVFYITCKRSHFSSFSVVDLKIAKNCAKQEFEGFGNSKIEQNKRSFSQSVYVSVRAESLSDLSGWETTTSIEGSFVKLHLSLDKRPPYATNYKRINV